VVDDRPAEKSHTAGLKFELPPKPIHPLQLLRALAGMLQN
jgi:hypothetical protein